MMILVFVCVGGGGGGGGLDYYSKEVICSLGKLRESATTSFFITSRTCCL